MTDSLSKRSSRVLLIEDDATFSERMRRNLSTEGFEVEVAPSGMLALKRLREEFFDLVVTDIKMEGLSGLDVLKAIRAGDAEGLDPELPVVVLTSVNTVETAVEAMKLGAADYFTKEAEKRETVVRLRRVLDRSSLLNENRLLRAQLESQEALSELVGDSPAMRRIKEQIRNLGPSDAPVLITGETGTGKEVVARALHRASLRAREPFLDVNCAALPDENLFQSELFGHEKGAFTGAIAQRVGRLELAGHGTIFFDEIAELSRESQAKILKTVEQTEITRVGGTRPIRINCRILWATNKDLATEVKEGRFREDLYYRINVIPLHVPALRERVEDIEPLMRFFLSQFSQRHRRAERKISPEALLVLQRYEWPGNVRELRNVAERLVFLARHDEILAEDLRSCGIAAQSTDGGQVRLPENGVDLEEVERQYVIAALERAQWSQKDAAALLGISVDRMNARVKKFNLRHPSWRTHR